MRSFNIAFGCFALAAVAGHAASPASVMRVASSVDSSSVPLGSSFELKFVLTPLATSTGPVVLMISFPEPPDRLGTVIETASISGGGQRLDAPSAYCGEGLMSIGSAGSTSTAIEARRCVIAQWQSAEVGTELTAAFRVTPRALGAFHLKTAVRTGIPVDRVPERQSDHEFEVDVTAVDGLCVAANGSICTTQGPTGGQARVQYVSDSGGPDGSAAKSPSVRAEPRELSGPTIGAGLGVLNTVWPHIDTFYDDLFLFPYFLWDVTRRAGAQGHTHNGLMRPTAQIETWHAGTDGVGDLMYDFDNVWTNADQRAGVDAHGHTAMVYDYLLHQLSRNGFDGQGGTMKMRVEYTGQCIWIWCWNQAPDNAS